MKLESYREMLNAINLLTANYDKQSFEICGESYSRIDIIIAIVVCRNDLDCSSFMLINTMYNSVVSELKDCFFYISKYERNCIGEDSDWMSCGRIKGKFLDYKSAMSKVKSLEVENRNDFWFKVEAEKRVA